MPITDALFLSAVIFAFILFAILLAWGDYQTRNLRRTAPSSVQKVSTQPKLQSTGIAAGVKTKETINN